jgi:hypothetical protein
LINFGLKIDLKHNTDIKSNNTMAKTITFNELRKIKDQLPSGSMRQIAEKLNLNEETVRNYFGGRNFDKGQSVGIHFEQGPGGGIVTFDDTTILDMAEKMIKN